MIIIKQSDLENQKGQFILIYARPKVGKTVTTLQTAPDPILWLTIEPRNFRRSLEAAGRKDLRYTLALHESYIDLIEFLNNPDKQLQKADSEYLSDDFAVIFFDGMSYFQNIVLPGEIHQEEIDGEADDEKKTIKRFTKVTQPQMGSANQGVFRVMRLLGNFVAKNKIVIVSCLEAERPKYEKEYEAGPALGGKQVPDQFPGFFDLIGRVMSREDYFELTDQDMPKKIAQSLYPPMVSFDENRGWLAGWTGRSEGRKERILNWGKILEDVGGGKEKKGKKTKPPDKSEKTEDNE